MTWLTDSLKKSLRGQERLWIVFYIYPLLVMVLTAVLTVFGIWASDLLFIVDYLVLALTLFQIYVLWVNAPNTESIWWNYLARFSALLILVGTASLYALPFYVPDQDIEEMMAILRQ